jgi:hypothetical protein
MKTSPEKQLDLREYRTLGLPLLALMGALATLGIIAAVVVRYFF